MAGNHDELMRQIAQDELEDMTETVTKIGIREYALARGMQPQLVYYYIRKGRIKVEACICGRKVIDIETADKFFRKDGEDGEA